MSAARVVVRHNARRGDRRGAGRFGIPRPTPKAKPVYPNEGG